MLGDISGLEKIYIVCGYTDMRKSIDGPCTVIEDQLKMDPSSSALFLFCGRRRDRIKALFREPDGFVLIYKRLSVRGGYQWPRKQSEVRNTRLDKAVNYVLNRRDIAETYLEDGRCSFTNNLSENAIRPFAVGRKNWLFCDTPNGAQASAIVYTMVEMAKANGVNVYHYLTYLLEKLPDDRMSDDDLELLAPWNETVKAEIERRANESNQSYVNCQGAPTTGK